MMLGAELNKAFVTAIGSLADGTLVSTLDNSRIHLWRHGVRVREVSHAVLHPNPFAPDGDYIVAPQQAAPVDCLAVLNGPPAASSSGATTATTVSGGGGAGGEGTGNGRGEGEVAFVTGGGGSVQLWAADGSSAGALMAPALSTPRSIIAVGPAAIAVHFAQAVPFNPSEFHLVPQDADQQLRRDEAMAARARQQAALGRVAQLVQVFDLTPPSESGVGDGGGSGGARSNGLAASLQPWEGVRPDGPPVSSLAVVGNIPGSGELVAGDVGGGLRFWNNASAGAGGAVGWAAGGMLQLTAAGGGGEVVVLPVVCLEPLSGASTGVLAASVVGTNRSGWAGHAAADVVRVPIPTMGGRERVAVVVLVDLRERRRTVLAVLAAHIDVVVCMCALPVADSPPAAGRKTQR
jgi:hypothetical protein